jgi:hypothetical protein
VGVAADGAMEWTGAILWERCARATSALRFGPVFCGLAACAAGEVCRVGLELPEAFGGGMAVTNVAQPEPGEIGEYDQEAQHSQEYEERGETQAREHPQRPFQAAKAG